jgi:hypothetical protein
MKTKRSLARTTNPKTLAGRFRTACVARLLPLLLLALPAAVQAQFPPPNYPPFYIVINNDNTVTITGYAGTNGSVNIPSSIPGNGVILLVTRIGDNAFNGCNSFTNVTIPNSVTFIGVNAFYGCNSLTSVTIPSSVASIGTLTLSSCSSLSAITVDASNPVYCSVDGVLFDKNQTTLILYPGGKTGSYHTIPNGVTSIALFAFEECYSLTSVTIPSSVTNFGDFAFGWCTSLTGVYFQGNAPTYLGYMPFAGANNATIYYLPGTTNWTATFGGLPTVLWNPQAQTSDASFGVRTNRFGFNITGSSNLVIVVETCSNLANPVWTPIGTNTLNTFIGTNGTSYFSDPAWTNYPGRFYRLRSP